ncbi:von Willebrand factor type A domain protein [Theileria parva strain Muguga]|uniref:Thrombospondin-related protein n=1 Tax=Theileria parva TaxID=5875 RepID=Q4N102_THEPA|nr:von Willebrand factor type A domain protein [Theileria parva strain Muguga]EAN31657.1 von Willebrand factor type A domain protein [Theileria parva strain Muguga]|eukprot:XP_763940.1 thrombospondin-related protein [Theileria parva strain Muguga]
MNVLKFPISYLIILIQFSYNNVLCHPVSEESNVLRSPKTVFSPQLTKSLKERLNHFGSLGPSDPYNSKRTEKVTENLSKEEETRPKEEDTEVKEDNTQTEVNVNEEENPVNQHQEEKVAEEKLNEEKVNEQTVSEQKPNEEKVSEEKVSEEKVEEKVNDDLDPAYISNVPFDTSSTDSTSDKEEKPQEPEEVIKAEKVDNLGFNLPPQKPLQKEPKSTELKSSELKSTELKPAEPKLNNRPKDREFSFTDFDGFMVNNREDLLKCINDPHDFVLVLDESESMSNYNWKKYVKEVTLLLASSISHLNKDNTLSIVHYSNVPTLRLNFQKIDPEAFQNTLDKINEMFQMRRSYGKSYTGKALEYVRQQLLHLPEIPEGSSSDSPKASNKVVILMTDGAAKDIEKAYNESLALRYNGVELFVFAVGFVNEENCRKLVGCPNEGHCTNVFYSSWNSILLQLQELLKFMCIDLGRNATCKEFWSDFSDCSRPCGGGTKRATFLKFTTLTEATAGSDGKKGLTCEDQYRYTTDKVVRCNEHPCPPDQSTLLQDLIKGKNGLSTDTDMLMEVKKHLRDDNTVDTHMRTKNLGDRVHHRHHSHSYAPKKVPEKEPKPDPVGTKILNDLLDGKKEPDPLPFHLLGENEHHVQVERILDQSEVDTPVRKHTPTSPTKPSTSHSTRHTQHAQTVHTPSQATVYTPPSPTVHTPSPPTEEDSSVQTESDQSDLDLPETPLKVDREVQTKNLVDQAMQTEREKVSSSSQTENNKVDGSSQTVNNKVDSSTQTDPDTTQELGTLTYDRLKQLVNSEQATKSGPTEVVSAGLDVVKEGVNKVDQHLKETIQQLQGGRWKLFVLKFKQKFKQLLENENFKKLSAVLIVIILSAISISFFSYLFLREREPVRRLFDPNDQEFMNAGDGDDVEPSENYQVSNMEDGIWA